MQFPFLILLVDVKSDEIVLILPSCFPPRKQMGKISAKPIMAKTIDCIWDCSFVFKQYGFIWRSFQEKKWKVMIVSLDNP